MTTKKQKSRKVDELRREYDLKSLSRATRGKYYRQAMAGTNLVLLEPEIARIFPDGKAVNSALRRLVRAGKTRTGVLRRRRVRPARAN